MLHVGRKTHVGHTVEGIERVEGDSVGYLRLLRITPRNSLIGDVATEEAVVTQYRAGYGSTQGGVHLTHQHRRLAERLRHPTGKVAVLLRVLIIYPQVPRPGNAEITAAEKRTIRLRRQCRLYLLHRRCAMGLEAVLHVVGIHNALQPREELVVFRDVLRH